MVELGEVILSAGKQQRRGTLSATKPSGGDSASPILEFKSRNAGKPVTINCADVESFMLLRMFDGYQWKLKLLGGSVVRFNGFRDNVVKELDEIVSACGKKNSKKVISTKGANRGTIQLVDDTLTYSVDGDFGFELPLSAVTQSVAQSKNEVSLELNDETGGNDKAGETLIEMRLFIPNRQRIAPAPASSKMKVDGDDDEMDGEEVEESETSAQLFARDVTERADLVDVNTAAIASFEKLNFLTPRGRYDVALYSTFMKLKSISYTYKILYKNISKMFLFEHKERSAHYFVIGLNPPVRQGKTAYPFLVVQFEAGDEIEININTEESKEEFEKHYGNLIRQHMQGPSHDVVTRVFKAFSQKKVLVPGNAFLSKSGENSVICSYKANEGQLYFLAKSLFFLRKPPIYIRHASITSIEFERISSSMNKRFGIKIFTDESGGKTGEYSFTNIPREEFENVYNFLSAQGLNLISTDPDSNVESVMTNSRSDDSHDPYLNKLASERAANDEDDESAEDEDYHVESDDDASTSGSELESEVSGSEDSDSDSSSRKRAKPKPKPKAAPAPKKKKAEPEEKEKPAKKSTKAPVKRKSGDETAAKKKTKSKA